MKTVNLRPHLKRNILIAAVLLLVCAAAFLNWSYNQRWGDGNSAMADAEDEMTTAENERGRRLFPEAQESRRQNGRPHPEAETRRRTGRIALP